MTISTVVRFSGLDARIKKLNLIWSVSFENFTWLTFCLLNVKYLPIYDCHVLSQNSWRIAYLITRKPNRCSTEPQSVGKDFSVVTRCDPWDVQESEQQNTKEDRLKNTLRKMRREMRTETTDSCPPKQPAVWCSLGWVGGDGFRPSKSAMVSC